MTGSTLVLLMTANANRPVLSCHQPMAEVVVFFSVSLQEGTPWQFPQFLSFPLFVG